MSKRFASWLLLLGAMIWAGNANGVAVQAQLPRSGGAPGAVTEQEAQPLEDEQIDELVEEAETEDETGGSGVLRRFWPRWRPTDDNERNHRTVREAFRDVVKDAGHSAVQVYCDNRRVAWGTVVTTDGIVLTKASELKNAVECRLADGRRLPAELVTVNDELDIAVLEIDAENLVPVKWRTADAPAPGSWLITVGSGDLPAAIGVVSASPRTIPTPRPILGVQLEPAEGGARVASIVPDSPAQEAGLKADDVIVEVNGKVVESREALVNFIQTLKPGDSVDLVIRRGETRKEVSATLTDFNSLAHGKRVDFQNALGGPLSTRRWGFTSVLQHDTVLRPNDCGGPILDLDGLAVGINIARAGRVASYAIPAQTLDALLGEVRSGTFRRGRDAQQLTKRIEELRVTVKQWSDKLSDLQQMVEDARGRLQDVKGAADDERLVSEELARLESAAADAKLQLDQALNELRNYENPGNTSVKN
jgi:serine protease Do